MSSTIEYKDENLQMLTNEVESWKLELHKEKIALYAAKQDTIALEYKLNTIKSEK